MLGLFQLLLAIFGIYSTLQFSEEVKLPVPLICLILMFSLSGVRKGEALKKQVQGRIF